LKPYSPYLDKKSPTEETILDILGITFRTLVEEPNIKTLPQLKALSSSTKFGANSNTQVRKVTQ
jgi:hypothetical protein